MKITIDTKEDSHEDLRKVLQLLALLVKDEATTKPETVDTSNLMNMFDQPEKDDKAPDFSSFLSLTQPKPQKKDEEVKVEIF